MTEILSRARSDPFAAKIHAPHDAKEPYCLTMTSCTTATAQRARLFPRAYAAGRSLGDSQAIVSQRGFRSNVIQLPRLT